MKKSSLIWLIIAACLVFVGGVAFCITMTVNHWDFSRLGNEKIETNTVCISEPFQDISIDSRSEDITFCLSEDGNCKVVCYERGKEGHKVSVRNGTLWIENSNAGKWYDFVSLFSFGTPLMTLYLPQDEYDSLSIVEAAGNIILPAGLSFASMDLSLSTGNVDCSASSSGMIHIKTTTGNICLEDMSAGEIEMTTSTGNIDVRNVSCKGNMGVHCDTGNSKLKDISCKDFSSSGNTGDIMLENVIASEMLSIERTTGDAEFEGCDGGEIEIITDTGNVTGSLLTSKVFVTHSNTGDIDVPETISGGRCKISTDTGDIRIKSNR